MAAERRPIRVMLVEDHNLVRAGIRAVIEGRSDIQVIAEATDGREAIHLARQGCPDVAVVDVAMPGMSGIDATREIRRLCPQAQVLILTAHDNEEYFFQTLKAGAVGYVLKKAAASDLIAAIEAARLRFRAVMMTSFAFIAGLVPLVIATGAGRATIRAVGTAVFGGMVAASFLGIFVIPGLYVLFQTLRERVKSLSKSGRPVVAERTIPDKAAE